MKKLALLALLLTAALLCTACAAPEASATTPEASTAQAEDFDYHYNLGLKYLSEGNYQEAVLAFTAAIDIDAKRAEAFVGRGDAYLGLDDAANARPDYERAIELDDALIEAYLGVIEACIRQNDFDAALEWAKVALDKTGDARFEDKIAELDSGNISDSAGNVRRTSVFDGDGSLRYYWEYTYSGNRRTSVTSYDGSGNQTGQVAYTYNAEGKQLRSSYFLGDTGQMLPVENVYDAAGVCTGDIRYNEDGTIGGRIERNYDGAGNLTEVRYMNGEGTLTQRDTVEYNAQGQTTRRNVYERDGTLGRYSLYEYDEAGRSAGQKEYNGADELIGSSKQIYEGDKRVATEHYDADGALRTRQVYD